MKKKRSARRGGRQGASTRKPSPDLPGISTGWNRRDFIRGSSMAALLMMMGGIELRADDAKKPAAADKPPGPPVRVGVIGLGAWGREILVQLARLPNAPIAGICDHYPASFRRAAEVAPQAEKFEDYRPLLEKKDIPAILVATPSHLHKEIVLAALEAGKHVYCESPMAHSIDDARAMAQAAKKYSSQVFQVGNLYRTNPQHHHVFSFVRAAAMGKTAMARAQFHKKQSWKKQSPNSEREKALNWRLDPQVSLGLIGEVGIHQVDVANWFLNARPTAVHGFGSITQWDDGRTVPDTIQAVFEYPGGIRMVYDATLANSFDGGYEMYYGSDAAIMIRENRAWMFKEVDAPLLGWEVYARKEEYFGETGIALVANATKLLAQGIKPAEGASHSDPPLYYALEDFVNNINDRKAPGCGWKEGFESVVSVAKANEAITQSQRVVLTPEMFHV